jgi:hypothetical protein
VDEILSVALGSNGFVSVPVAPLKLLPKRRFTQIEMSCRFFDLFSFFGTKDIP